MSRYFSERPFLPGGVATGDRLAAVTKSPSRVEVVLFCAAIRNFHRLHYDETYARAQGFSDLIVPGFLMGNWCIEVVTRSFDASWRIGRLKFRNTGLAYIGETFTVDGTVTSVTMGGDGRSVAACEIAVKNEAGQTVTTGSVDAIAP